MKRVLFAAIGLGALALAGTANAADLARRPPPAAAPIPMAVAYNWTGFYAGINAGGGFGGHSSWKDNIGSSGDFDLSGAIVGGTLGYNWQTGPVVFGAETDIGWTNIEGNTNVTCPLGCKTENTFLGTARGRIGYAFDRWMPYITGGLAYGDVKASTPGFPGDSDTSVGWTLGAGVEAALMGNWTVKGEYLYVDLDDLNCSVANCGGAGPTKVDFTTHIVRAGLNYRF